MILLLKTTIYILRIAPYIEVLQDALTECFFSMITNIDDKMQDSIYKKWKIGHCQSKPYDRIHIYVYKRRRKIVSDGDDDVMTQLCKGRSTREQRLQERDGHQQYVTITRFRFLTLCYLAR